MINFDKILIASDLDTEAFEILEYGITLGFLFDAEINCINVVQPSPIDIIKTVFTSGTEAFNQAKKKAIAESNNLLGHIMDMVTTNIGMDDYEVNLHIATGNIKNAIIEHAKKIHADLIVVGAHVDHDTKESTGNNLAFDLVDEGLATVMIVPSTYNGRVLDEVCLFINYDAEELILIEDLLRWTVKNDLKLICIHIMEDEENVAELKMKRNAFRRYFTNDIISKKVDIETKLGDVKTIVQSLSEEEGIDLMIMNAHQRHWNIFSKGNTFTNKVMKNIKVPVMVLKKDFKPKKIVIAE